jgi:hypothetical protein
MNPADTLLPLQAPEVKAFANGDKTMSQFSFTPVIKRGWGAKRLLIALSIVCTLAGETACGGGQDTSEHTPPASAEPAGGATNGLKPVAGETGFYVDSVNGKVPNKSFPTVVDAKILPAFGVGGWATDQQAQREAGGVIVTIDGKTDVAMMNGGERPDVVKFLKSPDYLKSGFTGTINTANLEQGVHTLTFKVLTADKTRYYEPKEAIKVEIRK